MKKVALKKVAMNTMPALHEVLQKAIEAAEKAKAADAEKESYKKKAVRAIKEAEFDTYYADFDRDGSKLIKAYKVVQERDAIDHDYAKAVLSPQIYERIFKTKKSHVEVWTIKTVDRATAINELEDLEEKEMTTA